ncbi:MAG: NAD-binding protein [Betaproteobacteria bacterium]|nr:NAD-binding protein [Betaproteobacteria bacterium]
MLYGNIADPELLAAAKAERAGLAIITVDAHAVAVRAVIALPQHRPHVSVIARARDLGASSALALVNAGSIHAYPEAIESSLRRGGVAASRGRLPKLTALRQRLISLAFQPLVTSTPQAAQGRQRLLVAFRCSRSAARLNPLVGATRERPQSPAADSPA